MSIKEDKRYKKRLYELGWYEDDDDQWRCSKCKVMKYVRECGVCKRCEHCHSPCSPDTEAGQAAIKDSEESEDGVIHYNYDIFGETL